MPGSLSDYDAKKNPPLWFFGGQFSDNQNLADKWRQQNLDACNSEFDSKTILALRRLNCHTKITRYSFDGWLSSKVASFWDDKSFWILTSLSIRALWIFFDKTTESVDGIYSWALVYQICIQTRLQWFWSIFSCQDQYRIMMPKRIRHFDFLAGNFQTTKIWRINGGQQNLDACNSELDTRTILAPRRQNCLTKFTTSSFEPSLFITNWYSRNNGSDWNPICAVFEFKWFISNQNIKFFQDGISRY